ncbi:MAG TPA: ATP-grasp domain-containing protein [Candidatus Saccharimonadales bacterium]|nr:ATP-grasp domain-containing protein [Candidatus Saccharimonadales bacterium]
MVRAPTGDVTQAKPFDKNIVLFINSIQPATYEALDIYKKKTGRRLVPLVVVDEQIQASIHAVNSQGHLATHAQVVTADLDSIKSVRGALRPYEGRIVAVTSQYENSIHELQKVIPFLPYLPTPTETSLAWATDKKFMREAFDAYDPTLSPRSFEVHGASAQAVAMIERTMPYPVIIKPSGLERSLLVSVVHDRQELLQALTATFRQLRSAYQQLMKRLEPKVLVEEFMDGDMYSVDTYVAQDGTCYHTPVVKVVTGRKAGFDDFFGHLLLSSAGLAGKEVHGVYDAAERAYRALGLRATTAHTELMRTADGWRIIEVGPRIGGFRQELYSRGYGINHIVNDILNRAGEVPEIVTKPVAYAAVFETYARTEGTLESIEGLGDARRLPSYITMKAPYRKGDMLRFARNGGDAAIDIELCSPNQARLQADIDYLEEAIRIHVAPAHAAAATVVPALA